MRRCAPVLAACLLLIASAPCRADERDDEGAAAARAQRRAAIERLAAEGRWDEMDSVPPTAHDDVEDWALQLRDRWWRPLEASRQPALPAGDAAGDVMARRRAWLAAGGQGPHPMPAAGEPDPWPVLAALVLDRQRRLAADFDDSGRLDAPELNRVLRDPPSDVETSTLTAIRMGLEKIDYAYDAKLDAASEEARRDGRLASGHAWRLVFVALGILAAVSAALAFLPRARRS